MVELTRSFWLINLNSEYECDSARRDAMACLRPQFHAVTKHPHEVAEAESAIVGSAREDKRQYEKLWNKFAITMDAALQKTVINERYLSCHHPISPVLSSCSLVISGYPRI